MVYADIDWVVLPSRTPAGPGRVRFSVFVSPRLGVDDGEPAAQPLTAYAAWVDWPATVGRFGFGIRIDDRNPVDAQVVSSPSSALWQRMFGSQTRVDAFVHEHLEIAEAATFDAMTIADGILDGYAQMATVEPVPETPWDETFWDPQLWQLPEPDVPGLDWITDPRVEVGPEIIPDEIGPVVDQGPVVGPAEEVVLPVVEGPRIIDYFPDTGYVVQQPDNSWAWSGTSEEEFLAANRSLLLGRADLELRAVPVSETFEVPLEWERFAAFNRIAMLRNEETPVGEEPVYEELIFEATPMPAEELTAQERIDRQYDFHRIVAALGEHPTLLRALGLVLDIECDAADVPEDANGLQLTVSASDIPQLRHFLPITRVTASPAGLVVRPRHSAPAPDVGLASAGQRCRIEQFDFEGAGRMLFQLADEEVRNGIPQGASAPTLRTTGLRLVKRGSVDELTTLALTNDAAAAAGETVLYAEDVQRGARIDVLDETTGRWHSLHQRRVAYVVGDDEVLGGVEDEGLMHLTVTTRSVAAGTDVPVDAPVGISDAIAAWDGWSLSAPRPGKVVSADPQVADPEYRAATGATAAVAVGNEALTSCGLSIVVAAAPGSLPRLRFGRSYRMRLRTVDLAGTSLNLADADAACGRNDVASDALTASTVFRRFEPVPPPDVTWVEAEPPDGVDRSGETERRLVVRTGLTDEEQVFGDDPGGCERLLVPPGCSVTMAEWHGAFDGAVGLGARTDARRSAYELAATESGSVTPGSTATPHLADPASAGVTLWDVPGLASGEVLAVDWPCDTHGRPQPLVLRLEQIEVGEVRRPVVDPSGRRVTVFLAGAERVAMKVASRIADPDLMALPHIWAQRRGPDVEPARVKMDTGTHPQLTPATVVELVHATPRPFEPPSVHPGPALAARAAGDTHIDITRAWFTEALSTANLVLTARWLRPRDDLHRPSLAAAGDSATPTIHVPYTDVVVTTVGEPTAVPLPHVTPAAATEAFHTLIAGSPDAAAESVRLDLGFTGRVRLSLRADATSRFAAFFPPSFREPVGDLPDHFTVVSEWDEVVVPNTAKPPEPVVTEILPLVVRHQEGDTWLREGGWLRVWLARPWYVTGESEFPAIVAVEDDPPTHAGDSLYPYVSLVGADPARGQRLRTPVGAAVFGGWKAAWVPFRSVDLPATHRDVWLSDRGVGYDRERDAWYTDLRVDLPQIAGPFVRLALVRDQPDSIPDAEGAFGIRCSEVVALDPITVLTDRTLVRTEEAAGVRLTLRGPRSPYYADHDGNVLSNTGQSVEVSLQRRTADGDPLLSWETMASTALADDPAVAGDPERLDKRQVFPYDPTSPAGEYRLLVVERDHSSSIRGDIAGGAIVDRIIYAETVPLTRAVVL